MEIINELIGYLRETCDAGILECEQLENRIRASAQEAYMFLAQDDAKRNIAIAENSAAIAKASKEDSAIMRDIAIQTKRDSSAMKTISVLGMFFLPGTFIAAMFAMPVFNWDAKGTAIVKPGFKYYWAATIPLTTLVFAVWAGAMFLPWRSWSSTIQKKQKVKSDLEEMRTPYSGAPPV